MEGSLNECWVRISVSSVPLPECPSAISVTDSWWSSKYFSLSWLPSGLFSWQWPEREEFTDTPHKTSFSHKCAILQLFTHRLVVGFHKVSKPLLSGKQSQPKQPCSAFWQGRLPKKVTENVFTYTLWMTNERKHKHLLIGSCTVLEK